MLYRVEIRKKDSAIELYGLDKDTFDAKKGIGFKTIPEVFRYVEEQLQDDPSADYGCDYAKLTNDHFIHLVPFDTNGQVGPRPNDPDSYRVIVYLEDTSAKSGFGTDKNFDEEAFATGWNKALENPKTPVWKTLLANPNTWTMAATLSILIGLLIENINPLVLTEALPYLTIMVPVFFAAGILTLLGSALYALVWEIQHPNELNPVMEYLRDRMKWVSNHPITSIIILGGGGLFLTIALICTIGFFTNGFGILPPDSFHFMQVILEYMAKGLINGLQSISLIPGIVGSAPEPALMSFATIASAMFLITGLASIIDSTCRFFQTAGELTKPPRIKSVKSENKPTHNAENSDSCQNTQISQQDAFQNASSHTEESSAGNYPNNEDSNSEGHSINQGKLENEAFIENAVKDDEESSHKTSHEEGADDRPQETTVERPSYKVIEESREIDNVPEEDDDGREALLSKWNLSV